MDKQYIFGRHGRSSKRQRSEIGIHALRGGTVTGEHEVFFFGQDEVLSIKHHAASRQVFAMGALKAARFLNGKVPGRYNMDNLLNEKDLSCSVRTDRVMIQVPIAECGKVMDQMKDARISPSYQNYTSDHLFLVVNSCDAEKLTGMKHEPVCEGIVAGEIPAGLAAKLFSSCRLLQLIEAENSLRLWALQSEAENILAALDKFSNR